MKNICFINYDYSIKDGARRVLCNLTEELSDKYNLSLISVFNKNNTLAYDIPDNVKYYVIIRTQSNFYKHMPTILSGIRKIINEQKVDILIAIGMSVSVASLVSTVGLKCKIIVCEHSSIYNALYSNLVMRINQWFAVHFADKLVVLTNECKNGYLIKYTIPAEKIETIPNWIVPEAYKSNEFLCDSNKILTIGRADPVKGYEQLLQVAKIVKPYVPRWQWHIWGDFSNEYGQKIINLAKEMELEDFLIFRGASNKIYDIYGQYSFYVLTSLYEGLPMVLLEAKANKLPLVAFDCLTGPNEIICDQVDGRLIPNGNVEEMAKVIIELAANPELLNYYSANSINNLEKFSLETIRNQWVELLESLMT